MKSSSLWMKAVTALIISLAWVSGSQAEVSPTQLVLYCGRGQSLVGPLVEQFRQKTGINIQVKYGDTAQLAATVLEEKDRSPADLFWAQDAASLGLLTQKGLFAPLPTSISEKVSPNFTSHSGTWVATSGRARVLAYSPKRVKEGDLPQSVFDLTNPKWKGRIGWAPGNASFQAFVTAMRVQYGDEKARQWLQGMKENGAKAYAKNTPILAALAAGEIDLGLPNHYYLLREKAKDPNYPVEQTFFKKGDIGNLLLVSGVGMLKTATHRQAAEKFIEFLLTPEAAQKFFAGDDKEFPVVEGVPAHPNLPGKGPLNQYMPNVDLDKLNDLQGTQKLLREVGLL